MAKNLVTLEELKFLEDSTSKQKIILKKIDKKVGEITEYVCKKTNRKLILWQYDNYEDDINANGFFDIKSYKKNIRIIYDDQIGDVGNLSFPTSYLFDPNWKSLIDKKVEKDLKKNKVSEKEVETRKLKEIKTTISNDLIQFILKNQKLFK